MIHLAMDLKNKKAQIASLFFSLTVKPYRL